MTAQAGSKAPGADVAPVRFLVPMIQVTEVERSAKFYRLLGFEIGNREPKDGRMQWVWLYQPKAPDWKTGANLMLTRSESIKAAPEEVLFYLYAADLVGLRQQLLADGLQPGEIGYPFYLPRGEFGIADPDGYCLMIAQAAPETP